MASFSVNMKQIFKLFSREKMVMLELFGCIFYMCSFQSFLVLFSVIFKHSYTKTFALGF